MIKPISLQRGLAHVCISDPIPSFKKNHVAAISRLRARTRAHRRNRSPTRLRRRHAAPPGRCKRRNSFTAPCLEMIPSRRRPITVPVRQTARARPLHLAIAS